MNKLLDNLITLTQAFIMAIVVYSFTVLAFSIDAKAAEYGRYYYSHHTHVDDLNETNPGFFYRAESFTVGSFENSYNDTAVYLSKSYTLTLARHGRNSVSLVADAGLLWGYGVNDGQLVKGKQLVPFVSPSVRYMVQGYAINLHLIPGTIGVSFSKTIFNPQ